MHFDGYRNNFPRIGSGDEKPDYPVLFPWGCDQLDDLAEFRPNSVYELRRTQLPYNIYIAIKYGIWSMPSIRYKTDDKSKYQKYLVFVCGNQVYGIAKVVGFDPNKSFKYWCYPEQQLSKNTEGYFGVINIKFVKLGKCVLDRNSSKENKLLNDHTALKLWRGLKKEDLNVADFLKHDSHEDSIRTEVSSNGTLHFFQSKFYDFHDNLKRREANSLGREPYDRCFYKHKPQPRKEQ